MKIDIGSFRSWQKDPITVALFNVLKEVRNEIEGGMINANNILAEDCQLRMTKLLGMREGIDLVLEMTYEDLDDGDDEDVEETDKTSGTQSSS